MTTPTAPTAAAPTATPTPERPTVPPSTAATLATFRTYLEEKGLAEKSIRAYLDVVRLHAVPEKDALAWLRQIVREKRPAGTIVQARAALTHWLRFCGWADEELMRSIPSGSGRQPTPKQALSPGALAKYRAHAEREQEPLRSLLLLLPLSGLRITEAVTLCVGHVTGNADEGVVLHIRGKGDKPRTVPLGPAGGALIMARVDALTDYARGKGYTAAQRAELPLFSSRLAVPEAGAMSASAAAAACRRYGEREPELADLSPHILRHTYATHMLGAGMELPHLQAILGHADMKTTQRYLHPTAQHLSAAVLRIGGL